MRNLLCLAVAAGLVWNAAPAGADLLLSESFDCPAGPLVTVSGGLWTHHSGSVTGEVLVANGAAVLNQTLSEDVNRLLDGAPHTSATLSEPLYAAFRLRMTALPTGSAGGYFAHFKDAGTTFRARVWATTNGASPGTYRLGLSSVSGTAAEVIYPLDLAPDRSYVVVTRLSLSTSVASLWIDPLVEGDALVATPANGSGFTAAAYALRQANGIGAPVIDDLRVGTNFSDVLAAPIPPPVFSLQPLSQVVDEGGTVTLTGLATGAEPLFYQWRFEGVDLPGATNSALTLSGVTTNQAGTYVLRAANAGGAVSSQPAVLTVNPAPAPAADLVSVVVYNVKGNGVSDWSTNSTQVRAIGRQLAYLHPDVIAFNEIPSNYTWEMTNFVTAFLPGYYLATNSGTDGYIRSVVASRHPIVFSKSWLDGTSLQPFGFNGFFTRDLFQARVAVPGFARELDVFVTHLKATTSSPQSDANKRGAEAAAISNFLVTVYLPTNGLRPCLLAGDLNEDVFRPETSRYESRQPVQTLVSSPTGLRLTTPVNPFTGADFTLSIQATLNVRFDYVLPNGLLFSNLFSSQVFRTDLLPNPPPPLLASDSATASDHLPVQVVFINPYNQPFRLTEVSRDGQGLKLSWESVPGQTYRVEQSEDLNLWQVCADGLLATGTSYTFSTNDTAPANFFRVRRLP